MIGITRLTVFSLWAPAVLALAAQTARASVHLMQIEQVIVGVNGDVSVQAIQLRMRSSFQNQMQLSRLVVSDATGSNPIELIQFPNPVSNHGTGVRILAASANFADHTSNALTPDFILTNLIPESYFAAGSLTFEDSGSGGVLWRLSWGGDGYTGPHNGELTNDDDGDFGPAYDGPAPSVDLHALRFNGTATALSTRNVDNYSLTNSAAEFTNNDGESGTIVGSGGCEPCDMNCDGQIDAFDIEPFLGILFNGDIPCDDCTGDANGDGDINAFDIEPFLVCLFG